MVLVSRYVFKKTLKKKKKNLKNLKRNLVRCRSKKYSSFLGSQKRFRLNELPSNVNGYLSRITLKYLPKKTSCIIIRYVNKKNTYALASYVKHTHN